MDTNKELHDLAVQGVISQGFEKMTANSFILLFDTVELLEGRVAMLEAWRRDHTTPTASEEAVL